MSKPKIYIALIHYPVYNKNGRVIATCITGFDLHDIARTAYTFGVKKYFVCNPLISQREFAARIIDCWKDKKSNKFNPTRVECFKVVELKNDLKEVVAEIEKSEGLKPVVVATSARGRGNISFKKLRQELGKIKKPYLLVFGSGWGITKPFLRRCDYVLEPIAGFINYNHLSVRSAAAIILDRLLSGGGKY